MKMTFGGHMSMTLTNKPYEPIKVESVLILEKEVSDDLDAKSMEQLQNKVNTKLKDDLKNKINIVSKEQNEARKRIQEMI